MFVDTHTLRVMIQGLKIERARRKETKASFFLKASDQTKLELRIKKKKKPKGILLQCDRSSGEDSWWILENPRKA